MSETSDLSRTGWRWDGTAWQAICTDTTLAACNLVLRVRCPDAPDGHLALTGGGVPRWEPTQSRRRAKQAKRRRPAG